ncbi:MAG TPA: hypothetical protein PK970_11280 [Hyphomicrobiaceae bacterium]|nr:hypothetical protein [Hyphomicrobiaceae bacterium]
MMQVVVAAIAYFVLIFGAGFCLGAVRELAVRPALGATVGIIIEVPLMLAIAWGAAGFVSRRFSLRGRGEAIATGVGAFVILIAAEMMLFSALSGRPALELTGEWATVGGMIGLAAQVLSAAFPALRVAADARRRAY